MPTLRWLCLSATLTACSMKLSMGTGDNVDPTGPTNDLDNGAAYDTAGPLPTSWGLTGDLVIADGVLLAESQALVFSTRDATCEVRAILSGAEVVVPTPTQPEGLVQAFAISGDPEANATCTFRGPTQIVLAFGPTDPQLAPAADRAGVSLASMYGLYLGEPGSSLLLVGLAGTQAQIEGADTPVMDAPVPDGTYRLLTLYGIPLTP